MIWLIFIVVLTLIFTLGAFIYLISELTGLILTRGVPFVSLSKRRLEELNKYIKLNSADKVVDLGCGDGRVLRMFEKQGVKNLTGYEINSWAYLLAKFKNKISKSKAKIYFKNFNKVDLSKYNVVFCYLMPNYLNSLKNKFDQELKPGTKIISYAFQIKNWHKPEIININNKLTKIFIYRI